MESMCLFCQIAVGDKPAYKIYEDDRFLGFLDIYPYGTGHTLVIPKAHHHYVWDVPDIGSYMDTARKLAVHLAKVMNTSTTYSMVFGEEVPHAHIHLLPPLVETRKRLGLAFGGLRKPQLEEHEAQILVERLTLLK